ncbi:hypothetical protein C9374_012916 [Naegleria lovaniensis]|uniref:Uncharacterized protein n=1 Tax=Naegleria lovaniensis TaxID=51637 RepID=A0AA88KBG5_NAELO|nr:uncharacterized protein C9374_012916 [Naegleria lovaniensis]KAG2373070.1 hypothetical protein C9374_012916 [Naegleria lovaniensis]
MSNLSSLFSKLKYNETAQFLLPLFVGTYSIVLVGQALKKSPPKKSERVVARQNAYDTLREIDADIQSSVKKLSADEFKNRDELINVVCSKQIPILQPACQSLFGRYYHSYKVGKGADLEEFKRVVLKK